MGLLRPGRHGGLGHLLRFAVAHPAPPASCSRRPGLSRRHQGRWSAVVLLGERVADWRTPSRPETITSPTVLRRNPVKIVVLVVIVIIVLIAIGRFSRRR
jgi:hypothetical protein